jgi:methionyl-tRNA synthetase
MPEMAEQLWQTLNMQGSVHKGSWSEALKPIDAGHIIAKPKPLFHKIDADEAKLEEQLVQVRAKLGSQLN